MNIPRFITVLILSSIAIFQQGCMSLRTSFESDPEIDSKVYIGSRTDIMLMGGVFSKSIDSEGRGIMIGAFPFLLIDLPLSFAMDTVLLPYTVSYKPPKHDVFNYYKVVKIKGNLTSFKEPFLTVSPSIIVSEFSKEQLDKKRVTQISLELQDRELGEFKKYRENFEYEKKLYVTGMLYPADQNGYVRMKVIEFQNAP